MSVMVVVFFLLCIAFFLLFGVQIKDLSALLKVSPKISLKRKIARADDSNRSFIAKQLMEIKQILSVYEIPGGIWLVYFGTAVFAFLGFAIGHLLQNYFLSAVLACAFLFIPMMAVKLYWLYKEKQLNATLEPSLNSITSSYLRGSGTLIQAVEENVTQLPSPLKQVFEHFLFEVTHVDSSVTDALEGMKLTIHNRIFHEWIDVLVQSQTNFNMKKNLTKILDKFADMRAVEAEVNTILEDARRSYLLMLAISVAMPFFLCIVNQDWQEILLRSTGGKLLIASFLMGVFVSCGFIFFAYQRALSKE